MIENCAIATMDGPRHDQGGTEYRSGHVTVTGDRITAVGDGPASSVPDGARRIDGGGCLATPGLVNTHHHLYQWLTQGRAQQSVLFDWLTELYSVWATIDAGQAGSTIRPPALWCGWRPRRAPRSRSAPGSCAKRPTWPAPWACECTRT